MKIKNIKLKVIWGSFIVIGFMCGIVYMVYVGILIPNKLFIKSDSVIGCDVSRYQGITQWEKLSAQGISFCFIKATEGSTYIDSFFETNWEQAYQTDLYIGAYHFFSFESPGDVQAKHFEEVVKKNEKMLPPVVDVEFYGGYNEKNVNIETIRYELNQFISSIKETYGTAPIIYTTPEAYDCLINGYYDECLLWIRSILTYPRINREWSFWQYTNREQLEGYSGSEKYIDMNVFSGSEQDLSDLCLQ